MRRVLRSIVTTCATTLLVGASYAQELLVQQFEIFHQQDKLGFFEKTIKEANTPEGQAIIGLAASYLGIDSRMITSAISFAASETSRAAGEESWGIIRSPVGYTICFAQPLNPNMGSGSLGVETHGESTLNTTIMRVVPNISNDDGLGWYMVLPVRAGSDSRVATTVVVGFAKAEGDWMTTFHCRPNGEHPWLAYNNGTTLNVPCGNGEPFCR